MAVRSLGTLTLDLVARIGGYSEGLSKAGRDAEKLSAAQKKAAKESEQAWKDAGVKIGLAFSAVALGAAFMVKSAVDSADALNDLSAATGIGIEDLAGLGFAAKLSASDLNGTADAINKLSVNIGKDAEKYATLGITAKEPIEAFKQLADVFVSIKDPQQRAAFGAEALGKSWQSAAPLLAEGGQRIGELIDQGKELSGVTEEMAIEAGKFNDELDILRARAAGAATSIAGPLVTSLNELFAAFNAARTAGRGFFDSLGIAATGSEGLERAVQQDRANLNAAIAKYGQNSEQFYARLRDLQANLQRQADAQGPQPFSLPNAAVEADPNQAKKLCEFSGGKWDGRSCQKGAVASAPKVSDFQKYVEGLQKQTVATKDLTVAEQALAEIQSGRLGKLTEAQKTQIFLLTEEIEATKLNAEAWSFVAKSIEDAAEASQNLLLENQKAAESYRDMLDPAREIGREMAKIQALVDEGFLTPGEGFEAQIKKLKDGYKELGSELDAFSRNAAEGIQKSIGDGLVDALDGNFKSISSSFGAMIKRILAEAAAANIARALFGSSVQGGTGSGAFGDILGTLGSIFGLTGARAAGGPTLGGGTYLVGEEGPELFTSNTSGYVMNAQQTAALTGSTAGNALAMGGVTYAPVIQIDSRADRAQIMKDVDNSLRISQAKLVDDLTRARRI
jgi:hypothetical protein